MKKFFFLSFLLFLFSLAEAQTLPVDNSASPETKKLYASLQRLSVEGVLFGHQDDLSKGVGWTDVANKSDIKDLTGEHPALYGWDLGKIELGREKNVSGIPFSKLDDFAREAYRRGGINTFSWHCNNPAAPDSGVKSVKVKKSVASIFSDPVVMTRYKSWLDKVAAYVSSLKGDNGELIPILFRPFHENTGSWFWWGKGHCTPDEYIKLWKFTVDYLRYTKNVHNLIYVYSTGGFKSKEGYLARYPGDDYVDVLAFDYYDKLSFYPQNTFLTQVKTMVQILGDLGREKKKVWAFAETGFKGMPINNWWSRTLLPVLKNSGLSYVMLWGNYDNKSYWGTFSGEPSAPDFKSFYKDKNVLFENRVLKANIYRQ